MSQQPTQSPTSLPLSQPSSVRTDDDQTSPKTQVTAPQPTPSDYFSLRSEHDSPSTKTASAGPSQGGEKTPEVLSPQVSTSTAASHSTSSTGERGDSKVHGLADNGEGGSQVVSRKSSAASVVFRPPRNPSLPQGHQRKTDALRLRASSPTPVKFERHVGFDNLPVGDATKNNPLSFTLNVRHQGYQPNRRSRTFMAGIDDHDYSGYALSWLLENLVDDGDEVVCVRVVEHSPRTSEKSYQEDAKRQLKSIEEKNTQDRAISIVLEYSVGKLHATFQQLIQIHQPSMLIVGTRGRSLGGIQGLVNTRNSFSKYCLQYSPVPVVVVRPDDQRKKKKNKRTLNPARQSYAAMIAASQGKHEADSEGSSIYELENQLSQDEEAHRVAAAIGLPAAFDPTIKPYTGGNHWGSRGGSSSNLNARPASPSTSASASTPKISTTSPPRVSASNDSANEDSGDDDDGEFEVMSGQQALASQKERLRRMEAGEAKALLELGSAKLDEEEEDDEASQGDAGGGSGSP